MNIWEDNGSETIALIPASCETRSRFIVDGDQAEFWNKLHDWAAGFLQRKRPMAKTNGTICFAKIPLRNWFLFRKRISRRFVDRYQMSGHIGILYDTESTQAAGELWGLAAPARQCHCFDKTYLIHRSCSCYSSRHWNIVSWTLQSNQEKKGEPCCKWPVSVFFDNAVDTNRNRMVSNQILSIIPSLSILNIKSVPARHPSLPTYYPARVRICWLVSYLLMIRMAPHHHQPTHTPEALGGPGSLLCMQCIPQIAYDSNLKPPGLPL